MPTVRVSKNARAMFEPLESRKHFSASAVQGTSEVSLASADTTAALTAPVANVMNYGAKANGKFDDTVAIQKAINTGRPVYFPTTRSFYRVTQTLSVAVDGQRLYGDGDTSQVRNEANDRNTFTVYAKKDVTIEDLFIKNTGRVSSGSYGSAVFITAGSSTCMVRHNRIEGTQGGITINNGDSCSVVENRITSTDASLQDSWDIAIRGRGNQNQVVSNSCNGRGNVGVLLQNATTSQAVNDNVVTSNTIGTHGAYGICVYSVAGGTLARNTISSNTVSGITGAFANQYGRVFGAGIYVQGASETKVLDNTVSDVCTLTEREMLTPAGIGLNSAPASVVSRNHITGSAWYGIMVSDVSKQTDSAATTVISSNVLSNIGRDGIRLIEVGNLLIQSNTITNVGQDWCDIYARSTSVRPPITLVDNIASGRIVMDLLT